MLRQTSFAVCFMLANVFGVGCATAVDDSYGGTYEGDASHDGQVSFDAHVDAGGDSSSSSDGAKSDSVTSGSDTRADSGATKDTRVEIDTYVEDTYAPPVDTYVPPTTVPCDYCLDPSSVCTSTDEDFDCFYQCVLLEGYYDCRYDKSASKACVCTD